LSIWENKKHYGKYFKILDISFNHFVILGVSSGVLWITTCLFLW